MVSLFYNQTKKSRADWHSVLPFVAEVNKRPKLHISSLTRILWSLTKLGCRDLIVLVPIISRIESLPSTGLTSQDMSNLAQSMRSLNISSLTLYKTMLIRCNDGFNSFSPIDQWNVLYYLSSFVEINYSDRSSLFLRLIPDLKLSEMSAKGLAALAEAYSKSIYENREDLFRKIFANFKGRPGRTNLGNAIIAKALSRVIPASDGIWQEFMELDEKMSSFEWILLVDAFVTCGIFDENLAIKMATLGLKISTKLDSGDISRAVALFSK